MKTPTTPLHPGSSIYDVADLAAVSISTVSRFLNHPEKLNVRTSDRVREAIDKLDYVPHGNAGPRSRRQVGRVGVLTPFFPAPSFVQRLQGITPVLSANHCELIVYPVETPAQLREYLHSLPFSKRLDGLVVLAMAVGDEEAQRLVKAGLEVVLVEHHHRCFCSVEADNVYGGRLAAEHLLSRGYRCCAFVGEKADLPYALQPSRLRWEGYSAALTEAGHPVLPEHVRLGEATVDDGHRMARELLTLPQRPRAVFAMSDLLAIGVLRAARELGLQVPRDVAVLGFDDIEAASYLELSTISQALAESGRLSAELLLGRIREPGRPLQNIQLELTVVPRATT